MKLLKIIREILREHGIDATNEQLEDRTKGLYLPNCRLMLGVYDSTVKATYIVAMKNYKFRGDSLAPSKLQQYVLFEVDLTYDKSIETMLEKIKSFQHPSTLPSPE